MVGNKGALCAAPTCKNYRKENPGMSFFRFPTEKKRYVVGLIINSIIYSTELFIYPNIHRFGCSVGYLFCCDLW